MFKTDLAKKNWESKYQYNNETPEQTQRRLAKAVASVEKNPEEWEDKFYNVLVKTDENGNAIGLKNTFGGRITANLGTEYKGATLINCFVTGPVSNASISYDREVPGKNENIHVSLKTEDNADNLSNIMLTLLEQAETLKSEGGYGINFGFIRPRGTVIKSIGIKHPGVVHYMRIWDMVASVIVMGDNDGYRDEIKNYIEKLDEEVVKNLKKQARKGAQMAVLPIWHPDVEEFIRAKQEEGNLTKFNISVLIDDAFMRAVENDDFYDLHFNGKVYKRVKARELYGVIVKSSHARNEPGVLFYDNMQYNNPLSYLGPVSATNPCLPKNMWIMTSDGPRQVKNLIDSEYEAIVNGKKHNASNFFFTGEKEVKEIELNNGLKFQATENHPVKVLVKYPLNKIETVWKNVSDLSIGDSVVLNNHRGFSWGSDSEYTEGWLMGRLISSGNICEEYAELNFYGNSAKYMRDYAVDLLEKLTHTKGASDFVENIGPYKITIKSKALSQYASSFGINKECKSITEKIEKMSYSFYVGFLQSYFDVNGVILKEKDIKISLNYQEMNILESIQRMLLRMGIVSNICDNELIICNDNIEFFVDLINFYNIEKKNEIENIIDNFSHFEIEKFNYGIKNIISVGKKDVYDSTVENIHEFDVNGCSLHNCGEVPGNISTSTVCLLGSVNLTQYVNKDRTFDFEKYKEDVSIFARMLDNINDLTGASLPHYVWAIKNVRQYGMGINGLGSTLYMMGIPYSSDEAVEFSKKVTWLKEDITWKTSALLAKEKGVFPAYTDEFLKTDWFTKFTNISEDTKNLIIKYGVRNGKTTTNPPLGNSSIICDNVTNGIEPVFSQKYMRTYIVGEWPEGLNKYNVKKHLKQTQHGDATVWEGDFNGNHYIYEPHNRGLCLVEEVMDYGYKWVLENYPEDIQNNCFYLQSTKDLSIDDHMRIQSVAQRNCNQSISKCLVEGQEVETSEGLMKIEDFIKSNIVDKEGFYDTYDNIFVFNENGEKTKVLKAYYGGKKPSYKITFMNGIDISCSENHSFKSVDGSWKRASEISEGDMIMSSDFDFNHGKGSIPIGFYNYLNDIDVPKNMSIYLSKFLGMLCASGYTGKNVISFVEKDDVVADEFDSLCHRLFGVYPKVSIDKNSGIRTRFINSHCLSSFIKNLIGFNSYNAYVPIHILNGSIEEKKSFLEGVSLSGYYNEKDKSLCLYSGDSRELSNRIKNILIQIYGPMNVEISNKISNHGFLYEVFLLCHHDLKTIEYSKRQKCERKDYDVYLKKDPFDFIDFYRKYSANQDSDNYRIIKKSVADENNLEYVEFSFVKSIEYIGEREVFDIEVEGSHQYLISGFVSHNTCNLPESYSFSDYEDLYLKAWKFGLNGFTTYREGSMEAVLSSVEKNNGHREIIKKDIKLSDVFDNGPMHVVRREGMKFYMHFSYLAEDTKHIFPIALWIHTNSYGEIKEGNAAVKSLIALLEKFEIDKELIDRQKEKIKGNPGHQRVAKMISMCLRHNIPIVNIVHVLDQIEDIYITDTIYAVKKFLSENIEEGTPVIGAKCPSCKSSNIVYAGGCSLCQDCGTSGCD